MVTPDDMADKIPCGPDPDRHADAIKEFFAAGYDEVHLSQVGDPTDGFFKFFTDELAPRL
jgi:hypothetical protein